MKSLIPLSFILMCFSAVSLADTYIHGSVGEAEFNTGGSPDMYEIGLGFSLSPTLSLEISYLNFGQVDAANDEFSYIEEEADGYNAALVADIPIDDALSFYFSAGYLDWNDTARLIDGGVYVDSYVVEGSDWNFGGGVKTKVFDGLDLKLDFTKYHLDDIEVESVTAGIIYRF